jgi:hypothetical protein
MALIISIADGHDIFSPIFRHAMPPCFFAFAITPLPCFSPPLMLMIFLIKEGLRR